MSGSDSGCLQALMSLLLERKFPGTEKGLKGNFTFGGGSWGSKSEERGRIRVKSENVRHGDCGIPNLLAKESDLKKRETGRQECRGRGHDGYLDVNQGKKKHGSGNEKALVHRVSEKTDLDLNWSEGVEYARGNGSSYRGNLHSSRGPNKSSTRTEASLFH